MRRPHFSHRTRRVTLASAAAFSLTIPGLIGVQTAQAAPDTSPVAADQHNPQNYTAGRYLVTFVEEPAATYEGTTKGFARTRPATGKKLQPSRSVVKSWRKHLTQRQSKALQEVGAKSLAHYTVATNGVAANLTAAQAAKLAASPGVVRVEKDRLQKVTTTYSPEYLGLSQSNGLWSQLGGNTKAGEGVIVGVLDTGIWPESKSFAGKPVPIVDGKPQQISGLRSTWNGACVPGAEFSATDCNDKLIGARYYVKGYGADNVAPSEYLSPRDGDGHGSHTASTAAGNRVEQVAIDNRELGTASGMAPGAKIAAYKVCWSGKAGVDDGCTTSDILAAIDDAVADGVDVINYSIGDTNESSPLDATEEAFRAAANLGIFVAAAAGNSGPDESTLDHPSPWLTTVAASTFRISEAVVQLGDGRRFLGASTTATLPTQTTFVSSASVKNAKASATDAALCASGSLDPAKTKGKLVQCDRGVIPRIDKSFEVKRAGGVGMVLTNTAPSSLNGDYHAVPSVHLSDRDRPAIMSYLGTPYPTAAIVPVREGESKTQVPEVAEFSSRGPSTTTEGNILKPDLTAPGVDVLAAVAPPSNHGRNYDYLSGTSMSSPHVAGLGALIKASHPTWSPSAVKSALMTSARDDASTTDPFAQGAGFVQPNKAVDPGLVFDSGPNDWRSYLLGLGVEFAPPFDELKPLNASDLNQASIAVGALAGKQSVTRTVTNVGSRTERYLAQAKVPGVHVAFAPANFTLKPGQSRKITMTLTRQRTTPLSRWAKGTITWNGSWHQVRIPVAVRPVAISAPTEVTGEGSTGSTVITVRPGFNGKLDTAVAGLVGAKPITDVVTKSPIDVNNPTPGPGVKAYTLDVAEGTTMVRFDVNATAANDDLDLLVYRDGKLVDWSASASGDEQVTMIDPEAGTYVAYINGFKVGGGGAFTYTQWVVPNRDLGNLKITDNAPVSLGVPVNLTATWQGLIPGQRYLGYVSYPGTDDRTVVAIG